MNMFKKNGGFTLVELIVVIAILAILAGVAIPAYSGYITKAQDAAAITKLDAIATAAQAANAEKGKISKIEVTDTTVKVTATAFAENFNADFVLFYGGTPGSNDGEVTIPSLGLTGTSYVKGATWENGKWTPIK